MHRFALPCACGLALALVGACSGASPQAFPVGQGGGGSGGSSSGGYGGSSGSHGGSGGSSGGGASGSSSGYSGGSSGGAVADSGDDAAIVVDDSGVDSSRTDGSASSGVLCKSASQTSYCQNGDYCCIATGFTGTTATCQSGGTGTCTGTTIHCAVTADCAPGEVCCGSGTTTGLTTTYTNVTCATNCPAGSGFTARYQFCDLQGNDCPSGKTCTASTSLVGYAVCR